MISEAYLQNHGGGSGNRKGKSLATVGGGPLRNPGPKGPRRGVGPQGPNRGNGPQGPNRGGGGSGDARKPSGGGGGGSGGGSSKGPPKPSQMPIRSISDAAKFLKGEATKNGFSKAGLKQGLRQVPGLLAQGAKTALKSQVRQLGARFIRGTIGRILGNHQPGQGYPAQRAAAAKKKSQAAALRKSVARASRSR